MNTNDALGLILSHVADAYAPNTIRAYRADFEEFIRFCEKSNAPALPANADTVARFVIETSQSGQRAASIRRKLVAIAAVHRFSRYPDPTKDTEVKLAIRKMHRKLGRAMSQAHGITENLFDQLVAVTSDDLRGKRDRALLYLAYDTMRRRSELVSLRIEDLKISDAGCAIFLRKSKTDQEGIGTWLPISPKTWNAIKAWLSAGKIKEGFLLRGVHAKGGVTGHFTGGQLGRVLKKLSRLANLSDEVVNHISGHSLRVGAAQDMATKGATLPQLMVRGGWTKVDTVIRYIESAPTPSSFSTREELIAHWR